MTTAQPSTTSRLGVFAAAGLSIGTVYAAVISFTDDDPHQWRQFLVIAGLVLVVTAIAFAIARQSFSSTDGARLGRTAVIFAVVGLLSLVVFWACLWAPLVAASVALAVEAGSRSARGMGKGPLTAVGLSAVTLLLAAVAAAIG